MRRLVVEQFPQWSALPVEPMASGGWDDVTLHLRDEMLVRLPSAAEYALAVDKEHRWLPVLAPQLPRPVPTPLAKGSAGAGYPYVWSVYAWLEGEPARVDDLAVRSASGRTRRTSSPPCAASTPAVGHGPARTTGTAASRSALSRRWWSALATLGERVDTELAREIWAAAVGATWDGVDAWFHGDLAAGNLLLVDGDLAAVIGFGTCGVGDSACDLAVAWTLLGGAGRQAFRRRRAIDPAVWARGRGWALWKTLVTCASTLGDRGDAAVDAWRALAEIFTEYEAADGAG